MVVFLESGAALALGEDDGRVEDLVEFGEVEPPAPESKTLVPDPAHIGAVWQARRRVNQDIRVLASPAARRGVVGDSIAESAWAVDLAERVDGANDGIGLTVVGKRVLQSADHGHAGDSRVDGQENIVEDDEGEEWARLCDLPGLVSVLAVVPVEVGDGDSVDRGDGQRHLVPQRALEDVLGDMEGVGEGRLAVVRVGDGRRRRVWRELED